VALTLHDTEENQVKKQKYTNKLKELEYKEGEIDELLSFTDWLYQMKQEDMEYGGVPNRPKNIRSEAIFNICLKIKLDSCSDQTQTQELFVKYFT
jgi:hypothetical protein